jgi:hypothetical protein
MDEHPKIIIMYKGINMDMGTKSTIKLKSSTYDDLVEDFDSEISAEVFNILNNKENNPQQIVIIFTNIEQPNDIDSMETSRDLTKKGLKTKLGTFTGPEIQIYFFGENTQKGGKKQQKLTKSNQKLQIGNQTRVVYLGARGGLYVKMNGNVVPVSKLKKK